MADSQKQIKCRQCGGTLMFAPGTKTLKCEFCGAMNEIDQSNVLECEFCHTGNHSSAIHCKHCGGLLHISETRECPSSKTANPDFAMYCKHCGKQLVSPQKPKTRLRKPKTEQSVNQPQSVNQQTNRATFVAWIWILAIGLIISIIICVVQVDSKDYWYSLYISASRDANELSSVNNKLSSTNNELNSLKSELSKMDSPIVISKIEVRNSGENYNQKIYSSNTTYINGKIYYFSTKFQRITLNVKFYKNNILSQGSGEWYHSGCSYPIIISTSAYKYSTFECNGWGNKTKGYWTAGDYRYEVWYCDKCLGVKHFTIY